MKYNERSKLKRKIICRRHSLSLYGRDADVFFRYIAQNGLSGLNLAKVNKILRDGENNGA